MKKVFVYFILFIIISGCSASKENKSETKETKTEEEEVYEESDYAGTQIIKVAMEEQKNRMYSTLSDTSVLYWLDFDTLYLAGFSKCNIYALNVLHKSGFKCPEENVRTYDLMDTSRFNDILPIIKFKDETDLRKGDLIVWDGHVIIYESYVYINDDLYAVAWWAGSKQQDNGINVVNNVAYGKFPLNGNFIVRRPVLK